MEPPQIFDGDLIRQRLARAQATGMASFLVDRLIEDLIERLSLVKRQFTLAADIATPSPDVTLRLRTSMQAQHLAPLAALAAPLPGRLLTGEDLELAPESLDLVTSVAALQFANDVPGLFAQVRRALKPDGLFICCLAGGDTLYELRACLTEAETGLTGGASPRIIPFADVRSIGALAQRAGFALPVVDLERITVRYPSMLALLADLRAMGATNPLCERARKPASRALFLRAAALYAERFSDADGKIRASFDWIWMSGWAPHASQQKPLAPGTAKMRLADALKTREIKPE
ncbi:MAG: methyltransferase domain-containing protein [Hyphomicrobiales bacterium]|nr:methyltransferase domain-containing protein [Hyphomicrobiales bacterium]